MSGPLTILPVTGMGEVRPGDDLAALIMEAATALEAPLMMLKGYFADMRQDMLRMAWLSDEELHKLLHLPSRKTQMVVKSCV